MYDDFDLLRGNVLVLLHVHVKRIRVLVNTYPCTIVYMVVGVARGRSRVSVWGGQS